MNFRNMTPRKCLGAFLATSPLTGLFAFIAYSESIKVALAIFGVTGAIVAVVVVGVDLFTSECP